MVERLHRQIKSAIKCHETEDWVNILPVVLLGVRTALKEDLEASSAEMVYGTGIRLPGEFFVANAADSQTDFANRLRQHIRQLKPSPATRHGTRKPFVFKELSTSPYVFLRHDAVKNPLQPPYDGPFKVISRRDKTFVINVNGKEVRVSIDRLKPAFVLNDNFYEIPPQTTDYTVTDSTTVTHSTTDVTVTPNTTTDNAATHSTADEDRPALRRS
ncbi:uncharacterized protein LOC144478033, partial [Augochlora pura]